MPTVTKTWTFASSIEGWTGSSWGWNVDGIESNDSFGSYDQITNEYPLISPAATWRDWGVPTNATAVTGIDILHGSRKRVSYGNLQEWGAGFQIFTAGSWPTSPVSVTGSPFQFGAISLPHIGYDSAYVDAGAGGLPIGAAYQSPTTSVQLYFQLEVTNKVTKTVAWDVFFNNFTIELTYTIPYTFPALTVAP
jgi:hypothetical protein